MGLFQMPPGECATLLGLQYDLFQICVFFYKHFKILFVSQAAEKALKAVQYSRNPSKTNVHDLVQISITLDDSVLETLSRDLQCHLGDSTRMRYPDQMEFPGIPNDVYTEEKARYAKEMARKFWITSKRKLCEVSNVKCKSWNTFSNQLFILN